MRIRRRPRSLRPNCDQLDDRCLLSGFSSGLANGLTPSQLSAAYGLNAITFNSSGGTTVAGNGAGETIALIEMYNDPNITSDLHTFDVRYGLPDPSLSIINQAGSQTNPDWAQEESLDVEWAHAIAPAANILVVDSAVSGGQSQDLQNLLTAVNAARATPGVVAISMSWGFDEMPNEASYDSTFTTPAGHTGITFVASSGDTGTVEYPATSPNVVAVGGTTLTVGGGGSYGSEVAWSSSGGGYSTVEPEPSYQESVQQSGMRSTPDVAFDGDPNTGVDVYSTDPDNGRGSWQVVGGTSLGAPAWAGMIAIVDQGRALAGAGSLDGPTQTLPALYADASSGFHAVQGSTSATPSGGYTFGGFSPAGFGFGSGAGSTGGTVSSATANTATGLGSPDGPSLISDLVSSTLTVPLSFPSTASGTSASAVVTGKGKHHHRKVPKRSAHLIHKSAAHATRSIAKPLVNQGEARKVTLRDAARGLAR